MYINKKVKCKSKIVPVLLNGGSPHADMYEGVEYNSTHSKDATKR
jgi:hypothetical protein